MTYECSPFCNYGHINPDEYCTTSPADGFNFYIHLHVRENRKEISIAARKLVQAARKAFTREEI